MSFFFFFNDTATTEIYTLSLHDALPIFLRMPPLARRLSIVDEVDRIRRARVFREAVVIQIEDARLRIDDDVFEDRAKAARGGVDLRLGLGREANRLRVASALEVEHGAIAPRGV